MLSVNIGIVNLLPIPVLDGGHLVFLAIEAGRSRPLSPRVLKFCSLGGLLAILVIFVLITGHDLARFGLSRLIAGRLQVPVANRRDRNQINAERS